MRTRKEDRDKMLHPANEPAKNKAKSMYIRLTERGLDMDTAKEKVRKMYPDVEF